MTICQGVLDITFLKIFTIVFTQVIICGIIWVSGQRILVADLTDRSAEGPTRILVTDVTDCADCTFPGEILAQVVIEVVLYIVYK